MHPRLSPFATCVALAALTLSPAPAWAQQDFGSAPPSDARAPQSYPAPQGQPSDPYSQGQPTYPPPQQQGQMPPPAPQPGQYGSTPAPQPGQGNPLQMLVQRELQDYGVQPQAQLQQTLHGPTPTSIPGGQVITTDGLLGLIQQSQQNGLLIFHVLGPGNTIPGALNAAPASQPGTFSDRTQQEFGQFLQQVTQGNKARPLVFYCMNTQCWMSYNAALRAINMGFGNVLWYRGGIEAWQQAQQLAGGMSQQQPGNGYR